MAYALQRNESQDGEGQQRDRKEVRHEREDHPSQVPERPQDLA